MIFEHQSKYKKELLVISGSLLLIGILYLMWTNLNIPSPTACTLEAKICPDGSAVGRTGPNCEFAACPAGI